MMTKTHGDRAKKYSGGTRTTPEEIGRMIRANHRECEDRAKNYREQKHDRR